MRSMWVFRSDLRILEYYHDIKDLKTFKDKCHDYYLLLFLWLLENDYCDEVIIWRLQPKNKVKDIIFNVNGKRFVQKFVDIFTECLKYHKPYLTLWRGGFKCYDDITKVNYDFFYPRSMYIGTGNRIYPKYGGQYDVFLQEDMRDFDPNKKCLPFYKTASPEIFHPIENTKVIYDLCWPCNWGQERYKGQDFFMNIIGHCPRLKALKIVQCGNKPEVGRKMAKKFNVTNIKFVGHVDRPTLNRYLNQSKLGLCLSNRNDGCPRVTTEILMSGTPMIIRKMTRLLPYYKETGVIGVNDGNIIPKIARGIINWRGLKSNLHDTIKTKLSFDTICQKNIDEWKTYKKGE